jgi:hypothetical protein
MNCARTGWVFRASYGVAAKYPRRQLECSFGNRSGLDTSQITSTPDHLEIVLTRNAVIAHPGVRLSG